MVSAEALILFVRSYDHERKEMFAGLGRFALVGLICILTACGGGGGSGGDNVDGSALPAANSDYTLLAWNDLGMHCLNPTYDTMVILPPYNTVWAQLIRRGSSPQLVTSGVTLEYAMVNNSSSVNKTYTLFGSDYGQFWTNVLALFGVNPADNVGLTGASLSGTMVGVGTHYEVVGIPLTPVNDSNVWNPYQVVEIIARDLAGNELARTRATVPTSDEINCNKCHAPGGTLTATFNDILGKHDNTEGTNLSGSTPVLCASCHGSPALGTVGPGSAGIYLSEAIHGFHANRSFSCYDCHPGVTTKCNRSLAHTAVDGNCTVSACHGPMQTVADSITLNGRVPWVNEPKCVTCHVGVAEVDTGTILYRNATGHNGVYCAGCHGSPHAMVPSREASDNYQAIQYQGKALSIASCAVCHASSRGEGSTEFLQEHGGTGNLSACGVCHTSIRFANTGLWPHAFQWRTR